MLTWIKKHQLISFFFLTYLIAIATTFTYIAVKDLVSAVFLLTTG